MKYVLVVMIAIILILPAMSIAHADYAYTTLSTPGSDSTEPFGINNGGTIVGRYYHDGNPVPDGYSLSDGTYTFLSPGSHWTEAHGINNAGTIVGLYNDGSKAQGFSLSGGIYTPLNYPGSDETEAFGINNGGTIVGRYYHDGNGWPDCYSLSGGTYTTLSPSSHWNEAHGINDAGMIVGLYGDGSSEYGFSLSGGIYTTLNYPGSAATFARGINNLGTIVGGYYDENSKIHGFVLSAGTYTPVNYPGAVQTQVNGINDGGTIVGWYYDGSVTRGFMARPAFAGDFTPADCDVDGSDLVALIANTTLIDLTTFAQNFGENSCQ